MRILFLCTGNSCRSQMAEGWARHLLGDKVKAFSAGTAPKGIDPLAVKVMGEADVDISSQQSKHMSQFTGERFDYIITVCDSAADACPIWTGGGMMLHHGFDDPPKLAAEAASESDALVHYRRVRDEIRAFIEILPNWIKEQLFNLEDDCPPQPVYQRPQP